MLKGQGMVILLGQPGSQGSMKDLYLHDPVSAELQPWGAFIDTASGPSWGFGGVLG